MGDVRPAPGQPDSADRARSRSDITVTLKCNNQCRFCPRLTLRHLRVRSKAELAERLDAIRAHSTRVVLTGGEVTLLSDVVELVARCRSLGFEQIGVITNGRALADAALARRMVDAGLTEACVTIHDRRAAVHDALTQTPGSLAETLQGLDNLLGLARERRSLLVRVNTLLCAANADGMLELLRELCRRGVTRFLVGDVLLSESYQEPLDHERVIEIARAIAAEPALSPASIQLRGYPLCLLREVTGIEVEPHDVDTAIVDEQDLDAYFAEVHERFVHVDACGRCSAVDRCLGIQRRYLEQLGAEHLAPIEASPSDLALAAARRELADFPAWAESGRLEVIPTTACPMRCTYCAVALGRRDASPEVLDRSVDLLLSSSHERLELQFFGGEPLLRRREVMRTMRRAAALARERGKRLGFVITTCGLHIDAALLAVLRGFDCKVMFSLDGPPDVMTRYRPLARSGRDVVETLERNLGMLCRSGVAYFVNMVVTPEAAADLPRRMRYVVELGARTVQLCYALGPGWTDEAQEQYCQSLRDCAAMLAERSGPPVRLQNIGSAAEPTVLSNDLLVDVDGVLYSDAALFGEKVLPGLREACRIGHVAELDSFDGLRRTREQNLLTLRRAYADERSPTRQLVEQQLTFGRRIQQTLQEIERSLEVQRDRTARRAGGRAPPPAPTRREPSPSERDRNPLQDTVLRRSLAHQARVMERRPELLPLPLLMLENVCYHDCLFCLSKPLEPTPRSEVARWLTDNRRLGLIRLGIAGNEPLAHPDIDRIVADARACGFERFEVLTSAAPLADPRRARSLLRAGVRGYAIPLYAADPAVHDAITQAPGSHADTVRAIENLSGLGADVHVHANLLRHNLDDLQALEALVQGEWALPLCIIPIRPKASNLPYAELMPPYADIVERARVRSLVAFPLCIAAQIQQPVVPSGNLISDLLKIYVLDQPFIKPDKCAPCQWLKRCSGTFQVYLDHYGDDDLTPQ